MVRHLPRGLRRASVLAVIILSVVSVSVAMAGVLEDRLGATRVEGRQVKQQLTVVEQRQQVTVGQIRKLNAQIAELDRPIGRLTTQISGLENRIDARNGRIAQLKKDYARQRVEIVRLAKELSAARDLLASRVVAAYKTGDSSLLEELAGAGSLRDMFDREEALGQVVGLDQEIIDRIATTERAVRVKRSRNHEMRTQIRFDIASLERDRADIDSNRAELESKRSEVASVRSLRDTRLHELNTRENQLGKRLDAIEEDAKVLKDVIKHGKTMYSGQIGGVSPSGLIWPVSGPVVSPFGQRWGRLHAGIDIAIGAGNPIHAAASGVVTYASWMSGYGNMVIIQHAGSLSTGYAHQSQIATSVGQLVTQGQVIGFVGCTGHCFGDHLHFETRIDGNATDPMPYL